MHLIYQVIYQATQVIFAFLILIIIISQFNKLMDYVLRKYGRSSERWLVRSLGILFIVLNINWGIKIAAYIIFVAILHDIIRNNPWKLKQIEIAKEAKGAKEATR